MLGIYGAFLDFCEHVKSFDDFAEYGVESVEVGRSADGLVDVLLLLGVVELLALGHHLVGVGSNLLLQFAYLGHVALLVLGILLEQRGIGSALGDGVEHLLAYALVVGIFGIEELGN